MCSLRAPHAQAGHANESPPVVGRRWGRTVYFHVEVDAACCLDCLASDQVLHVAAHLGHAVPVWHRLRHELGKRLLKARVLATAIDGDVVSAVRVLGAHEGDRTQDEGEAPHSAACTHITLEKRMDVSGIGHEHEHVHRRREQYPAKREVDGPYKQAVWALCEVEQRNAFIN